MSAPTDRFWTTSDGLRLYARDYRAAAAVGGERAPVICLHGLTRNGRDFEEVASWIAARGRRVIVPDVRGRGLSAYDPQPMNYAFPVYARDLLEMARALGISRAVVVGTSMGGIIALLAAAMAPELVAAAALNDIGPEISPVGLARIVAYAGVDADQPRSWDEATAYVRAANSVAFPDYSRGDWERFAGRLFRPTAAGFVLDYDPQIMVPLRAPAEGPAPDLWGLFAGLAAGRPLALIRGATSDVLAADAARRMCDAAPDMIFAEVPGVGHAPMLTEPAAQTALAQLLTAAP